MKDKKEGNEAVRGVVEFHFNWRLRSLFMLSGLVLTGLIALADAFTGSRALGAFYLVEAAVFVVIVILYGTYRTRLSVQGISFHPVGNFWRFRALLVPWRDIGEIGSGKLLRDGLPVLTLRDGTELWVWLPPTWRGRQREDVYQAIREWHARYGEAIGGAGSLDATSESMNDTSERLRWRDVGSVVSLLSALAIAVNLWVLPSLLNQPFSPPGVEVTACSLIPDNLAQRIVPGAARSAQTDNSCAWGDPGGQGVRELRVEVDGLGDVPAMQSFVEQRGQDEVEHVVHRLNDIGDEGYSWSATRSIDSYVSEVRIRVDGYLVRARLDTDRASTASNAERLAVDVARAAAHSLER